MIDIFENERILINQLLPYGIRITQKQAEVLLQHLELVIEKNKFINLTRIDDIQSGIYKHIVDSLLILPSISSFFNNQCKFIDIGTGAGYPGIPISIATNWNAVLVDSVNKKANAVKEFVDQLGILNVSVSNSRIETYAAKNSNKFDLTMARALAETAVIMEYSSPLLKTGGYLVLAKGEPTSIELKHAEIASTLCGFEYVSCETYKLPKNYGTRNIYVYKKYKEAEISLPRNVGLAKNKPLYK